jgi:hypothetical protein
MVMKQQIHDSNSNVCVYDFTYLCVCAYVFPILVLFVCILMHTCLVDGMSVAL